MDVYAQAMTPAKRMAQGKVVAMLRDTEKKDELKIIVSPMCPRRKMGFPASSLILLASPTGFEPVLPP